MIYRRWVGAGGAGFLLCGALLAQSAPLPLPKPRVPIWHKKELTFDAAKDAMGFPQAAGFGTPMCSTDGVAYFNVHADAAMLQPPEIYSVSMDGSVQNLRRQMPPIEYDSVQLVDFYVASHDLVSLLKAGKSEGSHDGEPRDARYFLSLTKRDGSSGETLPLDVRFRPLKVAMFGSGQFLVLGWDELNLQPELVVLKSSGEVQHFLEFGDGKHDGPLESFTEAQKETEEKRAGSELRALQRVVLAPFDDDVLLLQPGSAAAIRVLSPVEEVRQIPVEFPDGYTLHDALVTPPDAPLVLRARPPRELAKVGSSPSDFGQVQNLRVFEVDSYHGSLLREFTANQVGVNQLACAPKNKVSAVFEQPQPNADGSTYNPKDAASDPKKFVWKMVVETAPR